MSVLLDLILIYVTECTHTLAFVWISTVNFISCPAATGEVPQHIVTCVFTGVHSQIIALIYIYR